MTKASVVVLFVLFCISCSSSRESPEKTIATGSVGTVRAALSTGDYKSQVLGDGAVGYWRLGDTGSTAIDSAPRGNWGAYVGTYSDSPPPNQNQPGALLGESDTSAQFYVSNNYNHNPVTQSNWVQIPTDPNQSPTTASLSVEGWFTVTRGSTLQTYATIVVKTTSNMGDGYGLYWYSNALYFYVNKYNYRVGIPSSAMGDLSLFHHVVGTYDGTNINIYYDGNLADTLPLTAAMGKGNPVNAPAVDITIGRGWGLSWGGRLDEIAIYPNALSAAQVLSHFQAARPPGPLSRAFVAYAQQSLTFGTGDHVLAGDVGVASQASQSAGPQLVVGASDAFDAQRGVFAPSVSLGPQSQVGMVSTSALTNPNDQGVFGAQQPFPTSMPPLPLVQSGAPGTTNLTVTTGKTSTVYPGNYGALVVNGTAVLPAGSYSFSSITVGPGGVISPRQPGNTTVRVDTTLTTGTGATLFQQGRIAGAFVISVNGTDSSSSAPAVSIGANSVVEAVLNAPRGTVSIGDGSTVIGAVNALAMNVGNNVTMTLDGGAMQVVGCASSDSTSCDDGNSCTGPDTCQSGVCAGAPSACINNDLVPTVNCVVQVNSTTLGAVFGYSNAVGGTVNLNAGPRNWFSGAQADLGQPLSFAPGQVPIATFQTFPSSGQLSWTLGQRTATASASSPSCPAELGAALTQLFTPNDDTKTVLSLMQRVVSNPRFLTLIDTAAANTTLTPFQSSLLDALHLIIANADLVADSGTLSATQLARLPAFRSALLTNPAVQTMRLKGDAIRASSSLANCGTVLAIDRNQPLVPVAAVQSGSVQADLLALANASSLQNLQNVVGSVATGPASSALLALPGITLAANLSVDELNALTLGGPVPTSWFWDAVATIGGGIVGGVVGFFTGGPAGAVVGAASGGAAAHSLYNATTNTCDPCNSNCNAGENKTCIANCCQGALDGEIQGQFLTGDSCDHSGTQCTKDSDCGSGFLCSGACCVPVLDLCPNDHCTSNEECMGLNTTCQQGCCTGPCGLSGTTCATVVELSCEVETTGCAANETCQRGCCKQQLTQ